MKVALISNTFSIESGTGIAKYSCELMKGLIENGFDVDLIDPASMSQGGCRVSIKSPTFAYRVLKRIKHADVVHALSPGMALTFPIINKPKVVTYHDTMSLSCQKCRVSLYSHIINPFVYAVVGHYSDGAIAVSSLTKADLITAISIPGEKIKVIPHGVDDRFNVMRKSKKDIHVIGYIGALTRNKRVDFLIRAFKCLKEKYPEVNVVLRIYGGRPVECQRLQSLARTLNVEKYIKFNGFCPENKLVDTYNSFDVFVLPSEWEGFGIPILEAQRCGIPVVIRSDAHIPIETSLYCLKSSSHLDMADKIYALISDQLLRDNIIEAGMNYSKEFSWKSMVESTIKLYDSTLTSTV